MTHHTKEQFCCYVDKPCDTHKRTITENEIAEVAAALTWRLDEQFIEEADARLAARFIIEKYEAVRHA